MSITLNPVDPDIGITAREARDLEETEKIHERELKAVKKFSILEHLKQPETDHQTGDEREHIEELKKPEKDKDRQSELERLRVAARGVEMENRLTEEDMVELERRIAAGTEAEDRSCPPSPPDNLQESPGSLPNYVVDRKANILPQQSDAVEKVIRDSLPSYEESNNLFYLAKILYTDPKARDFIQSLFVEHKLDWANKLPQQPNAVETAFLASLPSYEALEQPKDVFYHDKILHIGPKAKDSMPSLSDEYKLDSTNKLPQHSDAVEKVFPSPPLSYEEPPQPKDVFYHGKTFHIDPNARDSMPSLSVEYKLDSERRNKIHLRIQVQNRGYWVSEVEFNIKFCNGAVILL